MEIRFNMDTRAKHEIICTECGTHKIIRKERAKVDYICRSCNTKRIGLHNKRYSPEELRIRNNIYRAKWTRGDYQKKREKYLEARRAQRRHLKMEVLLSYGGCCACCGETKYEFLSIDHINGGGTQHRKEIGKAGHSFYQWLKTNNYPEEFQVLCMNCNFAKGKYGYCPHN